MVVTLVSKQDTSLEGKGQNLLTNTLELHSFGFQIIDLPPCRCLAPES